MKKNGLLLSLLLFFSTLLFAQNYEIGNMSQTFTDDSRSRDIATDVYYPT